MIQKIILQILMAPFSLLYGIGVAIHQFLYRNKLLKSVTFDLPIIAIGNLTVGGTGKTPHTEYLIRMLKDYLNVGTLSRGYKRKSKGFLLVEPRMNASIAGDEPLQFKRKHPDIMVAVAESRVLAIPQMLMEQSSLEAIILDDAYQHRAIVPGLNILLTEFDQPFTRDYLLPAGRLREWRSGYTRADIIIVSKTPTTLSSEKKQQMVDEIAPLPNQDVFFSYYKYGYPYYLFNPTQRIKLDQGLDVILICAIAKTDYLMQYLQVNVGFVGVKSYEDHHFFSELEMTNLKESFEKLESERKIIVTTEKDAVRLEMHRPFLLKHRLPIFVLPVEVDFLFDEKEAFNDRVKNFLLTFKV